MDKKLLWIFHGEGLHVQRHDSTMNIWKASCCNEAKKHQGKETEPRLGHKLSTEIAPYLKITRTVKYLLFSFEIILKIL